MAGKDVHKRRRQILDAAMAIADEQGLPAISMRAVAERLGLTPMALYAHIGGKEGVLEGLVDRLHAELLPSATATGRPVDRLRALARAALALARRHPSAYALLLSRPAVTPDGLRFVEVIYAALLELGVPPEQVPRVERMISTFVLGYAASEVNGRFSVGTPDPARGRAQLPADQLPAHAKLAEVLDMPPDWDAEYEADLDELLGMLEHRWVGEPRTESQAGDPPSSASKAAPSILRKSASIARNR